MNDNQAKEFASLMYGVLEYYGKKSSKEIIRLYWTSLQCYELAEVKQAFSRHLENPDNGQFWPKIADIKRLLDGSTFATAALAWSKVDRAVKHIGPMSTVIFDDPIIHAVIDDMGGWIHLNAASDNDYKFRANEFQKRYQSYVATGGAAEYPRKLIGRQEAENAQEFPEFAKKNTRTIGDEQQAKLVYQHGGKTKALINDAAALALEHMEAAQ